MDALASGDARARGLALDAATPIGQGVAIVAGLLGLDHFIVGGEVAEHVGPEFADRVGSAARDYLAPTLTPPEVALTAMPGTAATVTGAAASLFDVVVARMLKGGR